MARALLAGAIAGGLILGIGGRIATLLVAIGAGRPANLSPAGVAETVIVGVVVGLAGGFLISVFVAGTTVWRGVKVGLVLLVVTTLVAWWGGRLILVGPPIQFVTFGVVAAVYVIYGICAVAGARRLEARARDRR